MNNPDNKEDQLIYCDIHGRSVLNGKPKVPTVLVLAEFDAPTKWGPWAYVCNDCYRQDCYPGKRLRFKTGGSRG